MPLQGRLVGRRSSKQPAPPPHNRAAAGCVAPSGSGLLCSPRGGYFSPRVPQSACGGHGPLAQLLHLVPIAPQCRPGGFSQPFNRREIPVADLVLDQVPHLLAGVGLRVVGR